MNNRLASAALAFVFGAAALAPTAAQAAERSVSPTAQPDNATLVASVKAQLLRSPDASALDIKVAARDGVVTLTGAVDTDVERTSAELIARSAAGVREVDNKLSVRADAKQGDSNNPVGNGSQLPRTSPTPATPGAPALPNGAAVPGRPGN